MGNTQPVAYLLQGKNIILVIDGKSHTISKGTHMNYARIVESLKDKDWDALRTLVEPKKAIIDFGKGYVSIDGDTVKWKGQPFPNSLSTRMVDMYKEGMSIDPMVRLMERLMKNPSKRSVDQFYGFLEKNNLPITEDGFFLAFKRVRADYMDVYSGTISNHIGAVVEMDRNMVDDNPESTCSTGLHFCSESYLQSFGSRHNPVMILKIDPADVVSIPTDYNGAKGRCAKYTVVAQVVGEAKDAFATVVNCDFSTPDESPALKVEVAADELSPQAPWPFPTGAAPVAPVAKPATVNAGMYNVVRMYNTSHVVHTGITLTEARSKVAKSVAQKKAVLKIVDSQGNTVV